MNRLRPLSFASGFRSLSFISLLLAVSSAFAQQPPAPAAGAPAPGQPAPDGGRGGPGGPAGEGGRGGRGGGGGRGGFSMAPRPADDATGFVPLFDGKTLAGWEGDPTFWRAEEGMIVGESTPENVVKTNSFLIWRGGTVKNFELKLDFRLNQTNSGIQYRSVELPDAGKWVLKGYQADMDFQNIHTGNIHEERGRAFLSRRGYFSRALANGAFKEIGTISDNDALKGVVKINDWNSYHIIARGDVVIHVVNGKVMAILIDEDPARMLEGLIGFQMHVGPPFKIEYKNILLRSL